MKTLDSKIVHGHYSNQIWQDICFDFGEKKNLQSSNMKVKEKKNPNTSSFLVSQELLGPTTVISETNMKLISFSSPKWICNQKRIGQYCNRLVPLSIIAHFAMLLCTAVHRVVPLLFCIISYLLFQWTEINQSACSRWTTCTFLSVPKMMY